MRRRLLPTEVTLVESILMEPEEDATVTAVNIIRALNAKRETEKQRVVVLFDTDTHQMLSVWGPYGSMKAAAADLEKGGITPSRKCYARLAVLVTSDSDDNSTTEEDA